MCHKFQGRQYYCLERVTILFSRNTSFEIVVLGVVQLMDEHKIFIRNYHGIWFWIVTSQGVPLSALSMEHGLTSSTFCQALGREGLAFVFLQCLQSLAGSRIPSGESCPALCHAGMSLCWWSGVVLEHPGCSWSSPFLPSPAHSPSWGTPQPLP